MEILMKNFKKLALLAALVASASITQPMFQVFKASALNTASKLGRAAFHLDMAARAKVLRASDRYYELKALPRQLVAEFMKPYAMYDQIDSLRSTANRYEKEIAQIDESKPFDPCKRSILRISANNLREKADRLEALLP